MVVERINLIVLKSKYDTLRPSITHLIFTDTDCFVYIE